MRLLLPLDSRPANRAALGLLDLTTGNWDRIDIVDVAEPFKRRGFRGCARVGDKLYVVNSAAIYQLQLSLSDPSKPIGTVIKTLRRPEWELGHRAAADLHDVCLSTTRRTLLIANSFMDSVDEVSLDLEFVRRHYLWDLCPEIAAEALRRKAGATDLMHINHIAEHQERTYLTLGNWNTTRKGCVVCFETGKVVLRGLEFPHDGVFADGNYFISESQAERIAVVQDVGGRPLQGAPHALIPVRIEQPEWQGSFQWVRGLAATKEHLFCGVTQWRNNTDNEPQIPPRIAAFDKETFEHRGDLFLPEVEGLPSPSIFSLVAIEGSDEAQIDFDVWRAQVPQPRRFQPTEHKLAFADDDSSRLSERWHAPPGEDRHVAVRGQELRVTSSMGAASKFYLQTGAKSLQERPQSPANWEVSPNREYELTVPMRDLEGALGIQLWVIEYNAKGRARHTHKQLSVGALSKKAGDGQFAKPAMTFFTGPDTDCIRLALRFSASGKVVVGTMILRGR